MLTESIEGVIGVDTHRDTLAAAVTAVGATLGHIDAIADAEGYRQLLDFAREQLPRDRCWAVEGTSSYGAGLTAYLLEQGEHVVEVCRPKRPPPARSSAAITCSNPASAENAKHSAF